MLTRVYIDNFRCFVNFEYRPSRKQLIFGSNGSGKSSFVDAVLFLRQIAMSAAPLGDFHLQSEFTRWDSRRTQTGEIEAKLGPDAYAYRVVLEPWGDPPRTKVVSETVRLNGNPVFSFEEGEVHLYNDRLEHKVTYPFDWYRSALATIAPRKDNQKLTRFKTWLGNVVCFRVNPFRMGSRADAEQLHPEVDLGNLAAWYRHLVQADPRQNFALIESLRSSMDGFNFLQLDPAGENVRLLAAEFVSPGGATKFFFHELSEGQRCLIGLYTILHFVVAKGCTALIDEPDNFISLREIQPWLTSLTDAIEENSGQVLLVSHHPEIIDQWAPGNGVQFVREKGGPVRAVEFRPDSHGELPVSELVARGWLH